VFPGHFGVAFAAKRATPRTSLGTLVFAATFLDLLWPILLLLGVERVQIVPGHLPANPLIFEYYPYSHSLAAAIVWSLLIGGVYYAISRKRGAAWVVGALVLSHWILDLPMHEADLALWPGSSIKVGFGLWRSLPWSILVDVGVFVLGLAIYLRGTRSRDRVGVWALWAFVAVVLLIFVGGFAGPPPANQRALGLSALLLWLFPPWCAWFDRHRGTRRVLSTAESPTR